MTRVDLQWLETAASVIEQGGIVALPFERLFGLAADALNPGAVSRIAVMKSRGAPRPISVILPAPEAIHRVAREVPESASRLARRLWPGPLTILVPARDDLPEGLVGTDGTIGVRVPSCCPAMELATRTDRVLTATSANPPGAPDPLTHLQVVSIEGIDLIVPGRVPGPPGSTVVGFDGDRPVILREGAISAEEISQ